MLGSSGSLEGVPISHRGWQQDAGGVRLYPVWVWGLASRGGPVLAQGRGAWLWGEPSPVHGQGGAMAQRQGFFSPLTVLGIWLAPFMFMSNRT